MSQGVSRLVVVGGASTLWTPRNVGRMALTEATKAAEVVLYDIDYERASEMAELCNAMVRRAYGEVEMKVTAARTLDEALPGADAVLSVYCNGGGKTENRINAISKRYGSKQDCFTAGPGACLYVWIQARPMIELVQAMQRHCPDAYLINCSNPLPALCMVAMKAGLSREKVLGYCGDIGGSPEQLAQHLDVDPSRVNFRIGGTNHATIYTNVWVDGEPCADRIKRSLLEDGEIDLGVWGKSTKEVELLRTTGALNLGGHCDDIFPTTGGQFFQPEDGLPSNLAEWKPGFIEILRDYAEGKDVDWEPTRVSESPILWLNPLFGTPGRDRFSVNMSAPGVVPNMPDWCVLDTECRMDRRGVSPMKHDPLPELVAEVVRRHHVTFEMASRAATKQDMPLLEQAIQLCPFGDYMRSAREIINEAREEFGADLFPEYPTVAERIMADTPRVEKLEPDLVSSQ